MHKFNEPGNVVRTCCDRDQIMTMDKSINQAEAIFGRCTPCLKNILRSVCDFTCASDQSRFLNAKVTLPHENGMLYIDSIEVSFFFIY